jgi:hypothetical protein
MLETKNKDFPEVRGDTGGDPQGATFSLWKITHRIHGAGIYMLTFGVHMGILMVNVTIYSSTMDPIEDFPGFSHKKHGKIAHSYVKITGG